MPLLILPFILILLSTFSLFRNRSQRAMQKQKEAFWEKEQRANLTRKQDISGLDYIQIPLDSFPVGQFPDERLSSLEQTLERLGSRQILNLSGISNTDLKLKYGAANLPVLSDCDANFTTLATVIVSYGERLPQSSATGRKPCACWNAAFPGKPISAKITRCSAPCTGSTAKAQSWRHWQKPCAAWTFC